MAVPRKNSKRKSASAPSAEPTSAPFPLDPLADDEEPVLSLKSDEDADPGDEAGERDDWEDDDVGVQASPGDSTAVADRREVDQLTERIFSAVLSRYGWEQHGNRIEHVGEDRRRR